MKSIPLTKGMVALVDDEDYEPLSKFKWYFHKVKGRIIGYAYRAERLKSNGRRSITIPMHKHILGYSDDMEGDHIDGNGLNNQRFNLRICTHAENLRNQALYRTNKLGVTGICIHRKKLMARIMINQKQIFLGYFNSLEDAKERRRLAEIEYFGDFRRKPAQNIG